MRTDLPAVKIGSIKLREISRNDAYDYYLIGRDKDTCKYLNWGPFTSLRESFYAVEEIFLKRPYFGLPIGYAITVDETMIGCIDFHTYNQTDNSCEIGYILSKEYWGLGIMTKCLKAATAIGFNHLGLSKIVVGHTVDNEASKKVILKCGFNYEYQKMVKMKEDYELGYYYSIYRHEWKGR